ERVVWDPSCQARSPRDNPVMLPMLPFAFPVPSYASEAFHDETARYFQLLAPALRPLLYPNGPVVLIQIDNEGALYFRDGAYDQASPPAAVPPYRASPPPKYETLERFQAVSPPAEGEAVTVAPTHPGAPPYPPAQPVAEERRFATIMPPTRFDAQTPGD